MHAVVDGTSQGSVLAEDTWAGSNCARPVTVGREGMVKVYPHQGVWIVEVNGPLEGLAADVDHGVQTALAEFPRAVVCSLPSSLVCVGEAAISTLAAIGRHAEAWPETPVVMACRDLRAWERLGRYPGGDRLRVASSMLQGWTHVVHAPSLRLASLALGSEPESVQAARRFVTSTCASWGLAAFEVTGRLVVSELATNALRHARSDFQVTLASDGATMLRVAVRDHLAVAPTTRMPSVDGAGGRGLLVVQGVASEAGALPTADGGKLVWATIRPDHPGR